MRAAAPVGGKQVADTEQTLTYSLTPRYPLRARPAAALAYEYDTPANRATTQPVALVVEEKKYPSGHKNFCPIAAAVAMKLLAGFARQANRPSVPVAVPVGAITDRAR
jgi:hypothetical protein